MELNLAAALSPSAQLPAAAGAALPVAGAAEAVPFANELAQWMMTDAATAQVCAPAVIAPELVEEPTAEPASDTPAADAAAMIWLMLGLPTREPVATPGGAATPTPDSEASSTAVSGLPATALGRRVGLPLQARASGRAGPTMPELPPTASPIASAALTAAFAKHLDTPILPETPGGAFADVLEALPVAASAAVAEAAAVPTTPALGLPAIERLNSLTAGLAPPADTIDPMLPQAPQQIAETVVWHLGKGAQEVQIRLNPEDLGQIDVSIKLEGEHVDVRFDAADASVRDVVQTSLPQLATLLSARGLTLDQAQVFSQSRGQQNPAPVPERRESAGGQIDAVTETSSRRVLRRGLVDDYV